MHDQRRPRVDWERHADMTPTGAWEAAALAAEAGGIRLTFPDVPAAKRFALAMYAVRQRARASNRKYRQPDDAEYGKSAWDDLSVSRHTRWLEVTRSGRGIGPSTVEAIGG